MESIAQALAHTKERISRACAAYGRPPMGVQLLAVSKTQPWQAVAQAVQAGQWAFGENYVQEGVDKIRQLRLHLNPPASPNLNPSLDTSGQAASAAPLQWHLIGPLQSNKTREVAEHFDWVHSVDRLKIAQRLSEQRPPAMPPLQVCLQVNISGEASKSGVAPADVLPLAQAVNALPRLALRGLMSIPEPASDEAARRAPHRALRELRDALQAADPRLQLPVLSMGMSDDLDAAIAEGATLVRVGTAIFGRRT
jgi:pyridoxal phosphate enzyme (YggS family)